MEVNFNQRVYNDTLQAVKELLTKADLKAGDILVVGCSTSEVMGKQIGSAGSKEIAESILDALVMVCTPRDIYIAIQCCEHLNRALVVEKDCQQKYNLEEVQVIPQPKAGGNLASLAMAKFHEPKVVEYIKAQAGIDIGLTLVGMHLKHVAVPVRLTQNNIGNAIIVAAKTRPKLIGGERARYK